MNAWAASTLMAGWTQAKVVEMLGDLVGSAAFGVFAKYVVIPLLLLVIVFLVYKVMAGRSGRM